MTEYLFSAFSSLNSHTGMTEQDHRQSAVFTACQRQGNLPISFSGLSLSPWHTSAGRQSVKDCSIWNSSSILQTYTGKQVVP